MYEKFLLKKPILKIIFWLMNHSGEYSAETIQDEIGMNSFTLVKYLHLLYTLDVCHVDANKEMEDLRVQVNPDSIIIKAFNDIRDFIDVKMGETQEIEIVLDETTLKDLVSDNGEVDMEELISVAQESIDNEDTEDVNFSAEDITKFIILLNAFVEAEK